MKIGIDISQVTYGTGVSRYTENLVRVLLSEDKKNNYFLFGGTLRRKSDLKRFLSTLRGSFRAKLFPIPPTLADVIWNRLHIIKIETLIGKVDVFHSSDWSQPPSDAFKVTTVHDLVPLKFPKLTPPKIFAVHKRRLKWVKEEVDRIIVPSETTRKDLVNFGVQSKRIRVVPEAPSSIYKPSKKSQIEKLKKGYKISGKYLLAVGTNPRKNIERIMRAFDLVRAGEGLKLIIIGGETIFLRDKERRDVRFVGHIPEEEMSVFYTGAEALVYPSLYEGFGLPILEAFSCKTPVVTSNFGSLKEVAGNAAVLVDPYDTDSIVEGIKEALKYRKELIKKGVKRVKNFSWKKTAKKTLETYNEVML